ncbi:MAG: hypothetical protein KBG15_07880 [Kofleriaceae bacterium]|nr:hypothetical protein [Kofleriaceae bacterium]
MALGSGGLSMLPAAAAAPFKRKCPQCSHPMSDHESVKIQIQHLVAQQPQPVQPQVVVIQMASAAPAGPARSKCEHCGANFAEATTCPECGAKAILIPPTIAPPAAPVVVMPSVAASAPPIVSGNTNVDEPWYKRQNVAIIALIFLPPLGIGLAWFNKFWSQRTRVMVSVASAIFFVITLVSRSNK